MQTYSVSPATIVFCDVVKFSLYESDKQRTLITSLNAEIMKELFPLLGTYGISPKAICVPTGDGLLCVILDDRDAQFVFSLLVSLRDWSDRITEREHLDPNCKLRIGVHVGEVSIIPDINRLPNVCSEDINTCRRIMDAARPNQVLFSEKAHEKLIGRVDGAFSCYPFSRDEPAVFDPPTTITVKHKKPLKVRVMKQEKKSGQPRWTVDAPISAPRVIEGVKADLERAEFICEQLQALLDSDRQEVLIYEMAQFSSFSIDAVSEELGSNHEMVQPLQRQLALLERLMCTKRTDVRVVLKTRIPATTKYNGLVRRYEKLKEWMERKLQGEHLRLDAFRAGNEGAINDLGSSVRFVEWTDREFRHDSDVTLPNRLVAHDVFRIDGYRLRHGSGHGLSLVYFEEEKIADAISDLEGIFSTAVRQNQTNETILEKLRNVRLAGTANLTSP